MFSLTQPYPDFLKLPRSVCGYEGWSKIKNGLEDKGFMYVVYKNLSYIIKMILAK